MSSIISSLLVISTGQDALVRSESGSPGLEIRADTITVALAVDKQFVDARSVALDPSGKIFVVDAARSTISSFDRTGVESGIFGGPGTSAGQFDEPTDVDPTNGLVLVVADAGNSRIQRYSRDFRFLESLPVPSNPGARQSNSPSFRPGSERVDEPADGRPISIATSRSDDLFVIESSSGSVFRWDRDRRNQTVIGDGPEAVSSIGQPIDLAISGDLLLVTDTQLNGILVFDVFGVYQRRIVFGGDDVVIAVAVANEHILAVFHNRLEMYDMSGVLQASMIPDFQQPENLVDAAVGTNDIYILTRQHLYTVKLPEETIK